MSKSGIPNLYEVKRPGGRVTYKYVNPLTGKSKGLGADFSVAQAVAIQANSNLLGDPDVQPARLPVRKDQVFANIADEFFKRLSERRIQKGPRAGKPLTTKTLTLYRGQLDAYKARWGALHPGVITRQMMHDFLMSMPPVSNNRHFALLHQLWEYMDDRGLVNDLVVRKLHRKDAHVQKQALDVETFKQIHEAAPAFLQNGMDLGIQTLQRVEDLVLMRFPPGDTIPVRQLKTNVVVNLAIGPELAEVIDRCRDDVPSPFLLHIRPESKRTFEGRQHWTQVSTERLSKAFSRVRDDLGLFGHLPARRRPSFHSIRGLGKDLYHQRDKVLPSELMGHTNAQTTAEYGQSSWVFNVTAGIEV